MKKLYVSLFLFLNVNTINLISMEQDNWVSKSVTLEPQKISGNTQDPRNITLIASDGIKCMFPRSLISYSKTVSEMLEDFKVQQNAIQEIDVSNVDSKSLHKLFGLLSTTVDQNKISDNDWQRQYNTTIYLKNLLSVYSVQGIEKLVHASTYLDIPELLHPLTFVWLEMYCKKQKIDLKKIVLDSLSTFPYPQTLPKDLHPLIEKFISLQARGVKIEKTINDLNDLWRMIAQVNYGILDLSNLELTSLEGLAEIPSLDIVTKLDLSHNYLANLEDFPWEKLQKLSCLNLANNCLTNISQDLNEKLPNLSELNIEGNWITLPINVKIGLLYRDYPTGKFIKGQRSTLYPTTVTLVALGIAAGFIYLPENYGKYMLTLLVGIPSYLIYKFFFTPDLAG